MKKVRIEDAVGMILAHDLTKIVPGKYKGPAFRKGHIVQEQDIDELKDMGKNHIYIIELNEDLIHENEAGLRLGKATAGEGLFLEGPSEGKVSLKAKHRGLLKIDVDTLNRINEIDTVMLATLHNNSVVEENQTVAGTRIIPLTIEKDRIEKVENICDQISGSVVSIKEFNNPKIGIVITGTEVFEGRIRDKFAPILEEKINKYGGSLIGVSFAPDNIDEIKARMNEHIDNGAEIIMSSGGMSVDADDVTPSAIRSISDQVITYGSPVLPGAMFMLAYKADTALVGIPACGMYHKTTALDLILPRILAGEKLSKKDINVLGHGGLCLNCDYCHFPVCPFGK